MVGLGRLSSPRLFQRAGGNMNKFWHWVVIVVVIFACIYVSNNYAPVSNIVG